MSRLAIYALALPTGVAAAWLAQTSLLLALGLCLVVHVVPRIKWRNRRKRSPGP